jgi:hypothetical protein
VFRLLLEGEFVEEVEVDVDGFVVQVLVVDAGLADPVARLGL